MTSDQLSGFSTWQKWDSEAIRRAPNNPGLYALRLSNSFGRLRGASDLVYIGCTESAEGTIKRRLNDHMRSMRLCDAQKIGALQVAWRALDSEGAASAEEAKLLREYYWDHLELPPVNRSEPENDVRVTIETVADFIQSTEQFRRSSDKDARELAERLIKHVRSHEAVRPV